MISNSGPLRILRDKKFFYPIVFVVVFILFLLISDTGFDMEGLLWRTTISATPLILGSLGEIFVERSGVMNLGVEGMMAIGAILGVIGAFAFSNPWAGLAFAILGGGILALLYGIVVINFGGMQVPAGLGLFMFGLGLSGILGVGYIGRPLTYIFPRIEIPVLSGIPILGKLLFSHDIIVYITFALVAILWFVLYKSKTGLQIRSTGEDPAAADSAGIHVFRVRYLCVIFGGVLAGMAGAYLSLAWTPGWVEGMVAGRGFIVIALTIFALWNPSRALLGAWLFGGIYAGQYLLQGMGIPVRILGMLPYIATIVALVLVYFFGKRLRAPSSLGEPYRRE